MHYYQHNIGDYARDTSHLTALEHGIYRLLLDWCYLNEKPITTELAIRLGRGNPDETQSVLSGFFTLENDGWVHKRVQKEIAAYHAKAEQNRKNGQKGGRKTQNEPRNNPVGIQSGSETQGNPLTHKPINPLTNIEIQEANASFSNIEAPPGFALFWQTWPKSTRKGGKSACLAKWRKAGYEKQSQAIAAHVQSMCLSPDWQKQGGEFIPAPLSYLNQARWDGADMGESSPSGMLAGAI